MVCNIQNLPEPTVVSLPRMIQGLIIFSTVFGVAFLWEVYPILPPVVFDGVAIGWVLFAVDSILTFIRPKISFYLGIALAVIALTATLSQPEHYALVASGNIPATVTIVVGSFAEALLIILGVAYLMKSRKSDPWAWPGEGPDTQM